MPLVLSTPEQNLALMKVAAAAALACGGVAALVHALRLEANGAQGKKQGSGAAGASAAGGATSPPSLSLAAAREYRAGSHPDTTPRATPGKRGKDEPQQLVYKHAAVDDLHGTSETTCLVFVGMPGRGKTAIAKRTAQYLSFFHGIACQVFSVADRRRAAMGYMPEDYYGDENEEGFHLRARYGTHSHTHTHSEEEEEEEEPPRPNLARFKCHAVLSVSVSTHACVVVFFARRFVL